MSKRSGLFLATLMGMLAAGGCTPKSGNDAPGTKAGGTKAGGTEAGGTKAGGTEAGGTEAGGTEAGGTEAGGTEAGGTEAGGTKAGGTEAGGTEAGGTKAGDDDGGTPPAGPQFSLIKGAVTRFEGTGAPAYAIAALDEQTASQTHRIWKLAGPAGTPNDHLTRWHVPTIVQNPAKCLEDGPGGEFTWDDDAKAWQVAIEKAKIDAIAANCEAKIDVGMGEAVSATWVTELVNVGVQYDEPTDDVPAPTGKLTGKCTGCHGNTASTGSGAFRMKGIVDGANAFSLTQFVAEIEDNANAGDTPPGGTSTPAKSYLLANAADTGIQAGSVAASNGACGGGGGLANKDLADIKRIAPGDPRNSLAVMLTDIPGQYKVVPEFIAYDYSSGGEFRLCGSTNNLEQIWMPKGKKNTSNTNYVWPKWALDKFARWVLQGAKTTDD